MPTNFFPPASPLHATLFLFLLCIIYYTFLYFVSRFCTAPDLLILLLIYFNECIYGFLNRPHPKRLLGSLLDKFLDVKIMKTNGEGVEG